MTEPLELVVEFVGDEDEPTKPDAFVQCPACMCPTGGPAPPAGADAVFVDPETIRSCALCAGRGRVGARAAAMHVEERACLDTVPPPPPAPMPNRRI